VHTPEHTLIKPQSRAKIFLPLSGLSSLKFQNQTQKNSTKEFRLSLLSIYSRGVFLIYSCG